MGCTPRLRLKDRDWKDLTHSNIPGACKGRRFFRFEIVGENAVSFGEPGLTRGKKWFGGERVSSS